MYVICVYTDTDTRARMHSSAHTKEKKGGREGGRKKKLILEPNLMLVTVKYLYAD